MATSPTQRTMRELRQQGRRCAIVEKFNSFVKPHGVRQDLFGIIDVIALDPERGVVGVQSCGQAFAAHERKLLEERAQECIDWLSTPGTVLELWGWRKIKLKRGGKAERWSPRVREFTLADFGLPERASPAAAIQAAIPVIHNALAGSLPSEEALRWVGEILGGGLTASAAPAEPAVIFCGRTDLEWHTWHHWWRLPDGTYVNEDEGGTLTRCPGLSARSGQLRLGSLASDADRT